MIGHKAVWAPLGMVSAIALVRQPVADHFARLFEGLRQAQVVDAAYMQLMKAQIFANWPASHSNIRLDDNETGHSYTYAQCCHFPGPPSPTPC